MHKPDMAQLWHKELMPAVLMLYITTVPYLVQGTHNCWESKWENCLQALALPCLTLSLQHVCCCITKGTKVGLLDGSMKALPSIPIHNMYHSLTKECPQVHQRGGWALFQVFPHLIMKDHPCHVQRVDVLEANNWTNNNVQWSHQQIWSQVMCTPLAT